MTGTPASQVQGSFKVAAGAHKAAVALVVVGWVAERAVEKAAVWVEEKEVGWAAARAGGCMQWMQRR
jgi:hypothetical protein